MYEYIGNNLEFSTLVREAKPWWKSCPTSLWCPSSP